MKELPVYKITIDDLDESGIEYVSLVESPAIQVKGLMFNHQQSFASLPPCHEYCVCYIDNDGKWQFGSTETSPCDYCQERKSIYEQTYNFNSTKYNFAFNEEKQIIAGPAIIPDLKIYRYDNDLGEYYVMFEKPTIEKMVEKFNKLQKEYKINLEHSSTMVPAFIKGSWIIEDMEKDKSRMYGFTDLPVGTWFIEVKVEDKKFWMEEVKSKNRNGFSIEGLMGIQLSAILKQEFQSYDDYPQAARDNACKVLRWRDEHGEDEVDGMTRVGWIRANQLCNGDKISEETIARMAAFERHRQNAEINPDFEGTPWKDRGYVAWLGWGGDEGIAWAQRKLQQIRQEMAVGVPHYTKDGKLWTGATHTDADGRLMTGAVHTADSEYLYHLEDLAEVGERGAIVESDKAPKSSTPNPDPQGEGTAEGSASSTRGAEVTERVEKILREKADDFNERYKEKLGYGVDIGMLKSVYQRGVGAYNVSHSPNVNSAEQWALARVNAFLYLIKEGRPENDKYVGDNDLLPKEHPKRVELNNTINKNQFNMKKRLVFRDYKLKNGATITIEGDMAIGSYVFLLKEDGSREQAPAGEHILEDGTTIFVDEEGYINEIRTAATTDVTEENEGMMMQVMPEEVMAIVAPVLDEMRMIIAELQSRVEMLEGKTDAAADILQVEDEMKKKEFSDIAGKINKIRAYIA